MSLATYKMKPQQRALSDRSTTHIFFATWARQENETANCRVNGRMIGTALEDSAAGGNVKHAALVTGLKHYLGSFDNYA
jgi:hypothetical protein